MKTLHTCKRMVLRAVILGMFFSLSGPLFCKEQEVARKNADDQVEVADLEECSELTQDQIDKMNILLSSLGMRAIREDALSYPGSKPNEIVGSTQAARLRAIEECLCEIKRILGQETDVEKVFSKVCEVELDVEFAVSKICTIDSKVDFSISKICEIDMNIGDLNNTLSDETLDAILDVNETTTFTIIQWLKKIYYTVK